MLPGNLTSNNNTKQVETQSKKSTYSHFMLETQNIIFGKEEFKAMVKQSNLNNLFDREQIIRHAKGMAKDEVFILFSSADNNRIANSIQTMEQLNDDIKMLMNNPNTQQILIDQRVRLFENAAYNFVAAYSSAQHNSKLGLQTVKEYGEIEKLFTVLNVKGTTFKNSFGVTISPEMLLFALGLVQRTIQKWDNVIIVDAMPGTGKTTFDYALTTTMIDIYRIFYNVPVDFNVNKHVLVNESRDFCNDLISNLARFSILMFIEAGNQFSSKKFYDDEQYELVNTVERIRFHGLTMLLEWNTQEGLDKTIRDRRATCTVSIEKRDKAYVRGYNLNPHARGITKNPRTKDKVAISAEAANQILEVDALTAIAIPYFPLPDDIMKQLDQRKETGKKLNTREKRNTELYEEYLITLPDNLVRITSEDFYKYAIKKHHALSIQKLAILISDNIGLGKTKRLYHNTSMIDVNEGYIEINDFARSYIAQLKAQYIGKAMYDSEKKEVEEKNGQLEVQEDEEDEGTDID